MPYLQRHRYWVAVVFFLLAAAPGLWFPALSNILETAGLGRWTWLIFMLPSLGGMISPLILGAQVDQRFQAEKVLGWIMILGAAFLYLTFVAIEKNWGIGWVIAFFGMNTLISAPAWSLLTTITLSSIADPGKSFGLYRVWGTIGWMVAGIFVSFSKLDFSPAVGQISAGVRIVAGVACFLMPVTLPKGKPTKKLSDALGFGALKILKERDNFVFFLTAFLFSIPLASFYQHTPLHLAELGVKKVSLVMTTAQMVETVALVVMSYIMKRYRVKSILIVAVFCGVLRYAFCAGNEVGWLVAGIMLHGICWTFFYEAGKVFLHRRIAEEMRGQAQALMSFVTGGLAGALGVATVKFLHVQLLPIGGWSLYWMVLTAISMVALAVFAIGYRSVPLAAGESD